MRARRSAINGGSLSSLVGIYRRMHGPRLTEYLWYFERLDSLDDAIRFACHGKDGKIHGHQHLVGRRTLERGRQALKRCAVVIEACESFDELLNLVAYTTRNIQRFGVLAVYDTSLRLGAYLDLWPDFVYLHAGTKKGCRALGVPAQDSALKMHQLPRPLQKLEA